MTASQALDSSPVTDDDPIPFADLAPSTAEVRAEVERRWSRMLDEDRYIGGPAVEAFEAAFADFTNSAHCVGVANGTDALMLTLRALGIGVGDEVIVPANTFIATAEAVVLAGATPRFIDVDDGTLLLRPAEVAAAIGPRTKAVIVVHLYGQMPDMDALRALTDATGVYLIEDAAQAHGASWHGRPAGSWGVAAGFSFYPGKNLGAFGDAGAVTTSDGDLAVRLRSMRDHGRVNGSHYVHGLLGTNSRLDAAQAIVLSAKLRRLPEWNAARRRIAVSYRQACEDSGVRMVAELPASSGVYHLAVIRVADRERARRTFSQRGIGTSTHYPTPCHCCPPYRKYANEPLPVTERAATELLSLPLYPQMSAEQVSRVCAALAVVGRLSREVSRG